VALFLPVVFFLTSQGTWPLCSIRSLLDGSKFFFSRSPPSRRDLLLFPRASFPNYGRVLPIPSALDPPLVTLTEMFVQYTDSILVSLLCFFFYPVLVVSWGFPLVSDFCLHLTPSYSTDCCVLICLCPPLFFLVNGLSLMMMDSPVFTFFFSLFKHPRFSRFLWGALRPLYVSLFWVCASGVSVLFFSPPKPSFVHFPLVLMLIFPPDFLLYSFRFRSFFFFPRLGWYFLFFRSPNLFGLLFLALFFFLPPPTDSPL